jgi:hypothetical protein
VWGYSLDNYHHNTLFLLVFWASFAVIALGVLWARIALFERTGLPITKKTTRNRDNSGGNDDDYDETYEEERQGTNSRFSESSSLISFI